MNTGFKYRKGGIGVSSVFREFILGGIGVSSVFREFILGRNWCQGEELVSVLFSGEELVSVLFSENLS
jgi:hypothetical protein